MKRGKEKEKTHTSRIQSVDIDTQIHRPRDPDPLPYFPDNPLRANRIDFSCFHDLEAAVAVVVVVGEAGEGGADAGVDVGVVG